MKALPATLVVASAVALVLSVSTPAVAAGNSIDPGDSLYAIDCDNQVYNDWQLLSVDPATAFSTLIGAGDGGTSEQYNACAGQPAWDATTDRSYYIQWRPGDGTRFSLAEVNVATGASTEIGEFLYWDGEFPSFPLVDAIAIGTDGAAFALAEGNLFGLNLATAELTLIGSSLQQTWAFAVDPTTGVFYAIDSESVLFSVDTADGSYEVVGQIENVGGGIYSLQIDGGGTLWIEADEETESGAGLWSFGPTSYATPVYSGSFIDDPYYTQALLIIPGEPAPKPALAATGADTSIAPIAAGVAGILALLGATLLVTRRRRAA